jgi:hypothetical protein
MNELDKILDGLIRRTSDGKLNWSRTAEANQFVTSVDTISVIVRRRTVPLSIIGGSVPEFRLEILDDQGTLIETFVSGDAGTTPQRREDLARLHELARHSALNIQGTLEKLAKALES